MHILILAKKKDNITFKNVNAIVQAKISLKENNSIFFILVTKHMVYKNYQGIANTIYYNKIDLYIKRFLRYARI